MADEPKPAAKPRTRQTKPKEPEAPEPTVLEQLRAPFDTKDVRQREGDRGRMLDYIGIDSTINRLLEVCPGYETTDITVDLKGPITVTKKRKGNGGTYDVDYFLGVVTLTLVIPMGDTFVRHVGVGADFHDDPDKVVKTALAEALKKAGHQVGIALYLWDEGERELVARRRELAKGDPAALKREVVRLATASGVELPSGDPEATAQLLADHFGITTQELQDTEVLKRLAGVEA